MPAGLLILMSRLAHLAITSPCSANWAAMDGSDRERFCIQCEKSVYDLSKMAPCEAETLLAASASRGEKPCVRIARRRDGSLVFGLAIGLAAGLSACAARHLESVPLDRPTGTLFFTARWTSSSGSQESTGVLTGAPVPEGPPVGICFALLPEVPSPEGDAYATPIATIRSGETGSAPPVSVPPGSYRWLAGQDGWNASGTVLVIAGEAAKVDADLMPPDYVHLMGDWNYIDPCAD